MRRPYTPRDHTGKESGRKCLRKERCRPGTGWDETLVVGQEFSGPGHEVLSCI